MAIPFFSYKTLTPQKRGGGTGSYSDLSNKPKINGVTLSGNKTSADLKILTYKKLEVKGTPLGIYDGDTLLTMSQVKDLYTDTKYYIYLEYLNIVFIPGARQSVTSTGFEFFGGFQDSGKAYHCRVIINSANEVKYNQIELAESPFEYTVEQDKIIDGVVVPDLNEDELIEVYNEYIKGRLCYVLDSNEHKKFIVCSSNSDPLSLNVLYGDKGVITYKGTETTLTLFGESNTIIETNETMQTSTLPTIAVPKLTKANLESIVDNVTDGKSVVIKNSLGEFVVTETDTANSEVRFSYFGYSLAYYLDGNNVIAEYFNIKTGTAEDDTDAINKKYLSTNHYTKTELDSKIDLKQDITDSKLDTDNKTIPEAINETLKLAQDADDKAESKTNAVIVAELPAEPQPLTQYYVGNDTDGYIVYYFDKDGNRAKLSAGELKLDGYAKENGTYSGMTVGKATADGLDNTIDTTYETKEKVKELTDKLQEDKVDKEEGKGLISDTDKAQIATNKTDIATNTAQIATNKTDITALKTDKVDVSAIVDNLTSTDTNKPLSAKQGKELKTLLDGISLTGEKGISIADNKVGHTNTITAQTTEKLYKVKYDAQGHITGVTEVPIANNLTTTSEGSVLDARQGKTLSDNIGAITDVSISKFTYTLATGFTDFTINQIRKAGNILFLFGSFKRSASIAKGTEVKVMDNVKYDGESLGSGKIFASGSNNSTHCGFGSFFQGGSVYVGAIEEFGTSERFDFIMIARYK